MRGATTTTKLGRSCYRRIRDEKAKGKQVAKVLKVKSCRETLVKYTQRTKTHEYIKLPEKDRKEREQLDKKIIASLRIKIDLMKKLSLESLMAMQKNEFDERRTEENIPKIRVIRVMERQVVKMKIERE